MPRNSEKQETRSGLRARFNLPVSIEDLREREYNGRELNDAERQALKNFDRYRVEYLENAKDEADFQHRYFQLRSWANLHSYEDFL